MMAGSAAIVGYTELPASRISDPAPFAGTLDMCAYLARRRSATRGLSGEQLTA